MNETITTDIVTSKSMKALLEKMREVVDYWNEAHPLSKDQKQASDVILDSLLIYTDSAFNYLPLNERSQIINWCFRFFCLGSIYSNTELRKKFDEILSGINAEIQTVQSTRPLPDILKIAHKPHLV
jgi:hypothetical protein